MNTIPINDLARIDRIITGDPTSSAKLKGGKVRIARGEKSQDFPVEVVATALLFQSQGVPSGAASTTLTRHLFLRVVDDKAKLEAARQYAESTVRAVPSQRVTRTEAPSKRPKAARAATPAKTSPAPPAPPAKPKAVRPKAAAEAAVPETKAPDSKPVPTTPPPAAPNEAPAAPPPAPPTTAILAAKPAPANTDPDPADSGEDDNAIDTPNPRGLVRVRPVDSDFNVSIAIATLIISAEQLAVAYDKKPGNEKRRAALEAVLRDYQTAAHASRQ